MNRILLPTDFSDTALKAACFAMDLYGSSVRYTLVNSFRKKATAEPLMPSLIQVAQRESLNGLRRVERHLRKRPGHITLEKVASHALLRDALNNITVNKGADLIVMGTQGKGHTRLFGRTSTNVIKHALLPVITVPVCWTPEPLRRILLTVDGDTLDEGTLQPLRELAAHCGAEVVVAHVRTGVVGTGKRMDRAALASRLKGIKHSYITAQGSDVVDTMSELASGGRIQLVAMTHRRRGFLGSLFHISTTKLMDLHTTTPLLVLQQG